MQVNLFCSFQVLLKAIYHWLYHKEDKVKADGSTEMLNEFSLVPKCDMTLLECSLFKPRDDIAYNIRKLRREMQERKTKYVLLGFYDNDVVTS